MSLVRLQQRRGTSAEWLSAQAVVLAAGEIGFETNTGYFKIGDGVKPWSQLSYFKNVADLNNTTQGNLSNYLTTTSTIFNNYVPTSQKNAANGVATLDGNGQVPTTQLQNVIGNAPEAYDTLIEIATILQDDETGLGALLTEIGTKVPKAGDTEIDGAITLKTTDETNILTAPVGRFVSSGEATLTSTGHALQVGPSSSFHLKLDGNEIQGVNSSNASSTLNIQPAGGSADFGGNINANATGATLSVGTGGITTSGNIVSTGLSSKLESGTGGVVTTGKIVSRQNIVDVPGQLIITSTDAAFNLYRFTGSSAATIFVQNVLAKGQRIDFAQWGTGVLTIAGSGINIRSHGPNGGRFRTAGQYATATLINVDGGTEYLLMGNLVV